MSRDVRIRKPNRFVTELWPLGVVSSHRVLFSPEGLLRVTDCGKQEEGQGVGPLVEPGGSISPVTPRGLLSDFSPARTPHGAHGSRGGREGLPANDAEDSPAESDAACLLSVGVGGGGRG